MLFKLGNKLGDFQPGHLHPMDMPLDSLAVKTPAADMDAVVKYQKKTADHLKIAEKELIDCIQKASNTGRVIRKRIRLNCGVG